ncbi:MAG: hypothetical protein AB1422_17875 [bacterium]
METEGQKQQSAVSAIQRSGDFKANVMWIMILAVYMALFCATGYVAFFKYEENPAINISPKWISQFQDPETRKRMLDTLKDDSAMFAKKRELATQSFNVVLGALLGFLSASAVSATRKKDGA